MRLTVATVCLALGLLLGVALESRQVSAATLGLTQRLKNVLVKQNVGQDRVGLVPQKVKLFAGPRQAYEDEYFDYEDEEEDEQAEEELQAALSETGADGEPAAGGENELNAEEEDDEGGDEEEEEEDEGEGDEDDDDGEERQLKRKYLIRNFLGITI